MLNTVLWAYFTLVHYMVQIMVLQFGEQRLVNGKALQQCIVITVLAAIGVFNTQHVGR